MTGKPTQLKKTTTNVGNPTQATTVKSHLIKIIELHARDIEQQHQIVPCAHFRAIRLIRRKYLEPLRPTKRT